MGGDFPPFPKWPGPHLQIKWKWGIQRLHSPAAEGKNRHSCSLHPSSLLQSLPYSPPPTQQYLPRAPGRQQMPMGTCQPPICHPRALLRAPRQGEGGRVTQGDTESQFQLPVPATGTRDWHTCGVKARLIITTLLQTIRHRKGEGRNPHPGPPARARGTQVFWSDLSGSIISTYFGLCPLPAPTSTTASWSCFRPMPAPEPSPSAGCYPCPRAERGLASKHLPAAPSSAAFHPFAACIPPPRGLSHLRAQHRRGKDFRRCLMSLWRRT